MGKSKHASQGISVSPKSRRQSIFKDIASDLVSAERELNRRGSHNNLGQAIARELEKAYQQGRQDERVNALEVGELEFKYIDIPRRFRIAFGHYAITLSSRVFFPEAAYIQHLDNKYYFYRNPLALDDETNLMSRENGIGASTIAGLLKLELLVSQVHEHYEIIKLSEFGKTVLTEAIDSGEVWGFDDRSRLRDDDV